MPRALTLLCLLLLALPAPAGSAPLGLTPEMPLSVDMASGSVAFLATVNPALADEAVQHLAVFKDGAYADKALLQAEITPRRLHEALTLLGFRPGDNMTMANWDSERVQGQTLNVAILPDGADRPVPLGEFLRDKGGRGLDMRFGGNFKAAVAPDASGCLICLFSCPMGIVSNHLTFFKETGWWGAVAYRAQWPGPVPKRVAVIVSRR
ncbi:hypothetical protein NNJEOMEG_00945 [Fundidesulfovibrio magnetotacticus]|uniref:4Fe-4S ferredoxin-type domain-containing protein n=1 Tax=Fundidesulfovibrio magnetotacticus TaxID=2730080 RepID=A0A6V8LTI1_9BACT|nr:YdjY domain-containing protein [Fundidesulfovibrio magnetotacticus]GFK93116.1 hypothetical protein NNJEOMEG_00945 [Fundidesulfovibrio magnetotacticus]